MFSTGDFAEWAKENVVLFLHNTSHCHDEPDPDLLRKTGGNGYPTVSFLSAQGKLLKQLAFPTEMATIRAGLTELEIWRDLKARAPKDPKARKQLFFLELDNRMLTSAEAKEKSAGLDLSPTERAALEQKLTNLEFSEIMAATPRENAAEAGAKYYAMWKQGRVPTSREVTTFWQYMFEFATSERDPKMFAECLADMKVRHATDPRLKRHLPALERQLKQLQGN